MLDIGVNREEQLDPCDDGIDFGIGDMVACGMAVHCRRADEVLTTHDTPAREWKAAATPLLINVIPFYMVADLIHVLLTASVAWVESAVVTEGLTMLLSRAPQPPAHGTSNPVNFSDGNIGFRVPRKIMPAVGLAESPICRRQRETDPLCIKSMAKTGCCFSVTRMALLMTTF